MAYVVDTTRFQAEGAYLRWAVIARRLGPLHATVAAPNLPEVLQLRWTLRASLGFPSEPFIVWRRHKKVRVPKEIQAKFSTLFILGNATVVDLEGSYSYVELTVSGPAGIALAFVGSPLVMKTVAISAIPAGNNMIVRLEAPSIEGLLVSKDTDILSVRGVRTDDLTAASGWEKLERVGIPVDKSAWAGLGDHGTDQGIFGAFTSAKAAAINRLQRGAPPIGWASMLDAVTPAPPWSAPNLALLVGELNQTVLEDLRQIAGLAPIAQAGATIDKPMPPPENSSGQAVSEPGSVSQVRPLSMTYMAAGTDCFACLGFGFGTAYPSVFAMPGGRPDSMLEYDYMITARYERGHFGVDGPVEYAAIVPAPTQSIAPPVPTNLDAELMGHLRPVARDADWRGSVRISWDKPVPVPLFRARSFAFARAGVSPAEPADLLMDKRPSGEPLPIAVNYYTNSEDLEPNRTSAVHREVAIPSATGFRASKYAVAHQDIYGQWSTWSVINSNIAIPGVDKVRIVSAQFKFDSVPTPPVSKCPASLEVEFLWDWRIRTPLRISFRGRLHAASYHGEPPPVTSLPGGLQTKLGGPFANTFTLNFNVLAANGAPTSSWPGYNPLQHCKALNPSGEQQVAFGAAQGSETRRYRVTIPGFELDYASTGHIGLALWAQGQEALPPSRTGPWGDQPSVISASDPRPPLVIPDIVALGSIPDAAGESHAVLKWSASAGADGYFIYETTETKILRAVGQPEPDPDKTLSLRLTKLKDIFDANPLKLRSAFVRRNSRLIKGTSADVTMSRGSTAIHLYVVLGGSAGQVEAAWPTNSDALYAFAAPRMPQPAAPMIEVTPYIDQSASPPVHRSKVRVTTRKGPEVIRIDLHRVRVDDAAKDLDTMGPPILAIDSLNFGWTTHTEPEPHVVAAVDDTPSGSWKRVWYRAVAWSGDDLLRGVLGTRSPASPAAWVVVPPSTPPNLSPLTLEWPGGEPGDVLVKWTSSAPIKKTPLGFHRIAISAKRVGAPEDEPPLIAFEGELASLGIMQPPSASGPWRIEGGKPVQYRAIIRRASVSDAVQVSVRITDPLGRTRESFAEIEAGNVLPDPVLENFVLKSSISPPGQMLQWTSDTPLDIGPYTLRVAVARPPVILFPNTIGVPRPFIVEERELADVPLDEPGPIPAGTDPLRVRRLPGPGPLHTYYAFVRVPFTQIQVRLTAPDGRSTQHIQLSS